MGYWIMQVGIKKHRFNNKKALKKAYDYQWKKGILPTDIYYVKEVGE
jgi:hypothetical protein